MFEIVWRDKATREEHTSTYDSQYAAVKAWVHFRAYANTEPLTITPEPDWARYVHGDGVTRVRKWPGIRYGGDGE